MHRVLPFVVTALALAAPEEPLLRVPGPEMERRLIRRVKPEYPILAKRNRITGRVSMAAVISSEGFVSRLRLISGHPLLVPAAMMAVRQWIYEPIYLKEKPVAAATWIEVSFQLPEPTEEDNLVRVASAPQGTPGRTQSQLAGAAIIKSPDGQLELRFSTVSESKPAPAGGELVYEVFFRGKPAAYEDQPAFEFIRVVPTSWDEMRS